MNTPAPKGTGFITPSQGATYARIMGVGGYRPERVVIELRDHRGHRLLRRVDPGAVRHQEPPRRGQGRVGGRHVRASHPRCARGSGSLDRSLTWTR